MVCRIAPTALMKHFYSALLMYPHRPAPRLKSLVPAQQPISCVLVANVFRPARCVMVNLIASTELMKDLVVVTSIHLFLLLILTNCFYSCLAKACQNNGQCPQICVPGPMEPTCLCEPGYESLNNGKQCVDIDECAFEFNKCSQFCNNTKGGYRCSCASGYSLEPDQITCKAASGRPMLIVATNHPVEILLNSDIASSRFLVQSVPAIKGIAYHDKMSTLYWITTEGVSRSNSGGQSLIYKINDLIPSGLALDKATDNIYYNALKNASHIGQDQFVIRVIAKSLGAEVNIITTQSNITDIALDSQKGILFWSEHTKPFTGRFVRATMDGRHVLLCGCIRLTRLCIRLLSPWIPSSHLSTGPTSHFNPFPAVTTMD